MKKINQDDNFVPKVFDKALYKKIPTEYKERVSFLESHLEPKFDLCVQAIRCNISGEEFNPFNDDEPLDTRGFKNLGIVVLTLEELLELEYELKQKYNEEGDK